ncbi:MAG: hypothetical protein ACRD1K_20570 [Acidimicrobiales bacterium]
MKGSGKAAPLDAKPEKRIVIVEGEYPGSYLADVLDTYVSHFATCPSASKFRRSSDAKKST